MRVQQVEFRFLALQIDVAHDDAMQCLPFADQHVGRHLDREFLTHAETRSMAPIQNRSSLFLLELFLNA